MSDFDPAKDAINRAKHGISLARVDVDMQVTIKDKRRDDGEDRYRAYGYIDGLPYCLVFADRHGKVRPISSSCSHERD